MEHISAVRNSLEYAKSVTVDIIIERNGAGGALAIYLEEHVRGILRKTRTAAEAHIGRDAMAIYTETNAKGQLETGFLTGNGTKGYGVHCIRRRLEENLLRLPRRNIITSRTGRGDSVIRQRWLTELSNYEIHLPKPEARSQIFQYDGKRGNKKDDLMAVTSICAAVCERNENDEERRIYLALDAYQTRAQETALIPA